jgi:ABC-type transporter Mla subunit MlaD
MNSDDKILKILEDVQANIKVLHAGQKKLEDGQKALQADVRQQGKDITSLMSGQEQQGKQLDQHDKLLAGIADNMATFLTEQQAQRIDIRSLHTEVHAAKDELKSEILSARSEAKADNMDLKATVIRQLKDHEKRIDALEEEVGIPHPDKN